MPKTQNKNFKSEDHRLQMTRVIIKDFIEAGPGFTRAENKLNKQLNERISCQLYNYILTASMRQILRHMEAVIHKNLRQNIKPLSFLQINNARTPMIQCRSWMAQKDLETFLKLLRSYFLKEKIFVVTQYVYDLYGILRKFGRNPELKNGLLVTKKEQKMKQRALKAMRKLENKGKKEAKETVVIIIDKESSELIQIKQPKK